MSRLTLTSALAALSVLAGCASTPPQQLSTIDAERVAAVDRQAARSGVRVIWVNPPEKRAP